MHSYIGNYKEFLSLPPIFRALFIDNKAHASNFFFNSLPLLHFLNDLSHLVCISIEIFFKTLKIDRVNYHKNLIRKHDFGGSMDFFFFSLDQNDHQIGENFMHYIIWRMFKASSSTHLWRCALKNKHYKEFFFFIFFIKSLQYDSSACFFNGNSSTCSIVLCFYSQASTKNIISIHLSLFLLKKIIMIKFIVFCAHP